MQSPLTNFFAIVGLIATIYYFGWNDWLVQQWIKWKTAAPKEAQEIEKVIKPITKTIDDIQKQSTTTSPSPTPTTTPKPESKYGVKFELKTPIGSINTKTQITPAEQEQLTRKDLGEKQP